MLCKKVKTVIVKIWEPFSNHTSNQFSSFLSSFDDKTGDGTGELIGALIGHLGKTASYTVIQTLSQ